MPNFLNRELLAFSTCLVLVSDVEGLHQTFADAMRRVLGKVPVAGLPRISRMKPGQTRFTVTDPAGNSVIFIKRGAEDQSARNSARRILIATLRSSC
jgi:hypothetical protein